MINNIIGAISAQAPKRPRAKFNLSHDVNTTADFGVCQPLGVQSMIPNSEMSVSVKQGIRLAPVVVPTFSRLTWDVFHYFVPISEVNGNFEAMMAQKPISRNGKTFVPQKVPHISLGLLSSIMLVGAKMNIWLEDDETQSLGTDESSQRVWCPYESNAVSGTQEYADQKTIFSLLPNLSIWTDLDTEVANNVFGDKFTGQSVFTIGGKFIGKNGDILNKNQPNLPSGNPFKESFLLNKNESFYGRSAYSNENVTLDNADLVLTFPSVIYTRYMADEDDNYQVTGAVHLAVRLSEYGKRWRKMLIGAGYQPNFISQSEVSIMKLQAYWLAQFGQYGIEYVTNFESTAFSKLKTWMDNYEDDVDINALAFGLWNSNYTATECDEFQKLFFDWVYDCFNCFATEPLNFVSAHTNTDTNSSDISGAEPLMDVTGGTSAHNIDSSDVAPIGQYAGNAYVHTSTSGQPHYDLTAHGYLDEKFLKFAYKWINRNSIAGQRIEQILRSQGLGDFVDSQRSYYVGHTSTPLYIDDVVSQSDTFKSASDEGLLLGEYGGVGIGSNDGSKFFKYETKKEYGFFVSFGVIVPHGGFTQQVDGTNYDLTKFEFYNPELDAQGKELTIKEQICGQLDWCEEISSVPPLSAGFGFIPRETRYKVAYNIANGDFSRRGVRSAYLPYTLDKFIALNDREVIPTEPDPEHPDTTRSYALVNKAFKATDLPIANPLWRYASKYEFLNNFSRIFHYKEKTKTAAFRHAFWSFAFDEFAPWVSYGFDNFIIHNIFNQTYRAPMLPIEDSYETTDEESKPNMSITKE